MRSHVCYCILGHRRVFRIFAARRAERFFTVTHLHPEADS